MLNTPEWNIDQLSGHPTINTPIMAAQPDVLSHHLVNDVAVMLVRKLTVYAEAHKARTAEQVGLPLSDYKALEYIVEFEALATGQLAQLMNLSASGISSLINRLESAGYIKRGKHPLDRRVIAIMPIKEKCEKIIAKRQNDIQRAVESAAHDNPNQVLAMYDFLLDGIESLKESTKKWLDNKHELTK